MRKNNAYTLSYYLEQTETKIIFASGKNSKMDEEQKKSKFWQRMKHKYHLRIFNDDTFQEEWYYKFTRLKGYVLTFVIIFLFILLITGLIFFTPVREFIPGYPNKIVRLETQNNRYRLDSLEWEMDKKDRFVENIQRILKNEEPVDYSVNTEETTAPVKIPDVVKSPTESVIKAIVEQENSNNLVAFDYLQSKLPLTEIYFFCPLEGTISYKFNSAANHLGTDIVAHKKDATVKATLSGVVIHSHWDVETGYMIIIQHDNDLISIYTHNSAIMSAQGDRVKAGEAIAVVGNTGELTTGPHLHFELWHKGRPINPEEYILF